jgi:quercetin dioxygenase-like cupin family protein
MTVGNETQTVEVGDCIFIPSNEPHGLVKKMQSPTSTV